MEMAEFKAAMTAATGSEKALRDALLATGVPERDLRQLRSRVLVDGRSVVVVGTWTTDVVEKVAAALEMAAAVLQIPENT